MDLKKHTLPSLLELDRHTSKPTVKIPHTNNTKLQTLSALNTPVSIATKPEKPAATIRKAPPTHPAAGTLETVYEENLNQTASPGSNDSRQVVSRYSPEKKILKKLYTDTMYKQFSDKLDNLRRKYDYVYKNVVKDTELDVEKEKIKDIVLKSENLFNTTYSIKYFGIKDNQIGILSKRVALGQKPGSRQDGTIQSYRSDNGRMRGKDRAATSGDRGDFGSDLVSKSYRRHNEGKRNADFMGHERLKEPMNKTAEVRMGANFDELKHSLASEAIEHTEIEEGQATIRTRKDTKKNPQVVVKSNLITKIDNFTARPNLQGGSALNSLQATSDHETPDDMHRQNEREVNEIQATIKNTSANYKMSTQAQTRETNRTEHGANVEWGASAKSPNGYMVTQYFIPRRLQSQKKPGERKEARKLTGLDRNSRDQAEINTAHFERTLKSLPKVKRSMLRNVTAQTQDDYTDELDVLEDHRTHEMKAITSNIAKFSYSTLLKSINTTEALEDTFVEKNRMLEKVIKKREQMKQKGKMGVAATRSLYNEQSGGFDQLLKRGNTVNVKVENSEDEMYKTYVKLKKKL